MRRWQEGLVDPGTSSIGSHDGRRLGMDLCRQCRQLGQGLLGGH